MESGKEVTLFTDRVIIVYKGIDTEVRMEGVTSLQLFILTPVPGSLSAI